MRFIRKWSYACANALTLQLSESHEKRSVYYYGFQIIIGGIVKMAILFVLAYISGMLKEILFILLFFASLRTFTGGYHMDTYGKCMITSIAIFLGTGAIIKYTGTIWSFEVLAVFSTVIFIIALFCVLRWAPAETPNKSIGEKKKTRFKIISIFHISFWLPLSILFSFLKLNALSLAGCIGVLLAVFIITPAGYSFFDWVSGKRHIFRKA